jgi:hypothetical protein
VELIVRGPDSDTVHGDTVHGDTVHCDAVNCDAVHSDAVHSDTVHADTVHADTVHADTVHADTVHGGTVHGDAVHGDTDGLADRSTDHVDADQSWRNSRAYCCAHHRHAHHADTHTDAELCTHHSDSYADADRYTHHGDSHTHPDRHTHHGDSHALAHRHTHHGDSHALADCCADHGDAYAIADCCAVDSNSFRHAVDRNAVHRDADVGRSVGGASGDAEGRDRRRPEHGGVRHLDVRVRLQPCRGRRVAQVLVDGEHVGDGNQHADRRGRGVSCDGRVLGIDLPARRAAVWRVAEHAEIQHADGHVGECESHPDGAQPLGDGG